MTAPDVVAIGHLTLDDVVLRDGTTSPASPGGAALYAAVGATLAGASVALVSRRGLDFPQGIVDTVAANGITLCLDAVDAAPVMQWVLYEGDGSRRFVLHPESGDLDTLSPRPSPSVVSALTESSVAYLAPLPVRRHREWCAALRGAGPRIVLDPHHDSCAGSPAEVWRLLPDLAAFLPSQLEAVRLAGDDGVVAVRAFHDAGARIVSVKLGEHGSLVSTGAGVWHVPAPEVPVVDVTGAGDAYGGAFAAALAAGADPVDAARLANAVASFTVQHRGALAPLTAWSPDELRTRLDRIRPRAVAGGRRPAPLV